MESPKIAINARVLADYQVRGWARYTVNLLEYLCQKEGHFYLFTDRPLNKDYLIRLPKEKYTVFLESASYYAIWEQVTLPQLCRKHDIDLLHCPVNYGLPQYKPCPTVLTIHDAIAEVFNQPRMSLKQKLKPANILWKALSVLSRKTADHVITVSEYSKKDLVQCLGVPKEKITVVYEAADPCFSEEISEMTRNEVLIRYGIEKPYFFYVGGWEERKNVSFLIENFLASEIEDFQLVLAGGQPKEVDFWRRRYHSDRLHFLGWVEDEDLPALYKSARAFIYPSLYEGFGLQIVEAMKVGCPVLCSDRTSLPEIVGHGGELFSLDRGESLIGQMKRLREEKEYTKMSCQAKLRGQEFNWKKTADETWNIYMKLLGEK